MKRGKREDYYTMRIVSKCRGTAQWGRFLTSAARRRQRRALRRLAINCAANMMHGKAQVARKAARNG